MDELPKVIVNILEETGYSGTVSVSPATFEWMKCIDKLNPFYEWLTCCVTESNFVTKDDLLYYNYIVQSGKLLTEEELDSRLSNYFSAEPTVYVDEVSVDGINSVITEKKKILDKLNFLKAQLNHELDNKDLENYDDEFVEQLLNEEVAKVYKLEKEYKQQFRCLEGKILVVLENLSSLENSEPKYLCQQDLRSYLLKNANLDVYTEILKKKIFQEEKSDKAESNLILDDHMNSVYNWLRYEELKCGNYKAKELAADEVILYLSDCEANIDNINYFFGKENTKNSCTKSKPIRPNEEDLLVSCEFYLMDLIRGIQLNICEERLSRKKKYLSLLEELENIVKIRKLCNSSLYYLFIKDWKTIRMSISLLKEFYDYWQNEFSEYEKRMALMKRIIIKQKVDGRTFNENYEGFSQLFNDATLLPEEQSQTICTIEQKQFCSIIEEYKKNILSNFKNYLTVNRNINSEIMKVDRFIFNGPTRSVRYNDDIVKILGEIYALMNCQTVSINYEIKEFNKFKESLQKNDNLLHMMWYEWNKNPFNVIQAVLKMEESVKIKKRRLSIMAEKELTSVEFNEYSRF